MKMKLSIVLALFLTSFSLHSYTTTLNYNDFLPHYSTQSHFSMMNEEQRNILKDDEVKGIRERLQFSTTFFAQKATFARDLNKIKVHAGDVHGRLNMIGLTYGNVPTGQTQPALLNTAATLAITGANPPSTINNPALSDLNQNFGFFSLPTKYRKTGARFSASCRIHNDFFVEIHTGIVDIKQTLTLYIDRTNETNEDDVYHSNTALGAGVFDTDKDTVETGLMDQRTAIFRQMNINGEDWNDTGFEDVTIGIGWRHNFDINSNADSEEWAQFIFTPHLRVSGVLTAGKEIDPDILLSLPFGNNKHHAVHVNGGFTIDFHETIGLSFEGGATHFFDRTYETRVPTHELQSVLFPYKADVKVKPGKTWHMSVEMNAQNFIDKLSIYINYSYVNHLKDTVDLVTANTDFIPSRLEDQTNFKAQMAMVGLNYDIAPNATIGFAWQAPIAQRASYKTNTILLSGIVTF